MPKEIRYAENIIVAVTFQGEWFWYVSDKALWILDLGKLGAAARGQYGNPKYEIPDNDVPYRFNMPIVNEDNAAIFLGHMTIYLVSTDYLSQIVKLRVPRPDLVPLLSEDDYAELANDVIELFPALLVDFDKRELWSLYPEPYSFEDYIPDGWFGTYQDFWDKIPNRQRYWVIEETDYFEPL